MKKVIFFYFMIIFSNVFGVYSNNFSKNRSYKTDHINMVSVSSSNLDNINYELNRKRHHSNSQMDKSSPSLKKSKLESKSQQFSKESSSSRNLPSDLIAAVKKGKEDRVRYFVETKNMSVNLRDKFGKTLLEHAVYYNHENIVKYLIKNGADVNAPNKKGFTPIMFAESVTTVKYLLKHGAKLNTANECGDTVLHLLSNHNATENNYTDIIKYLIDHGANVNLQNEVGNTPLHLATRINNEIVAKYLIDHDSFVNKRNLYGNTPLIYTILNNNMKLAQYLIDHGANVDYKYVDNNTALTIAENFDRYEIVDLLKKAGAK